MLDGDELQELYNMILEVQKRQLDILHKIDQFRSDMAIIVSRQNSDITDSKKNLTPLPIMFNG